MEGAATLRRVTHGCPAGWGLRAERTAGLGCGAGAPGAPHPSPLLSCPSLGSVSHHQGALQPRGPRGGGVHPLATTPHQGPGKSQMLLEGADVHQQ